MMMSWLKVNIIYVRSMGGQPDTWFYFWQAETCNAFGGPKDVIEPEIQSVCFSVDENREIPYGKCNVLRTLRNLQRF